MQLNSVCIQFSSVLGIKEVPKKWQARLKSFQSNSGGKASLAIIRESDKNKSTQSRWQGNVIREDSAYLSDAAVGPKDLGMSSSSYIHNLLNICIVDTTKRKNSS